MSSQDYGGQEIKLFLETDANYFTFEKEEKEVFDLPNRDENDHYIIYDLDEGWQKLTLAAPGKISVLSGITCDCNLTKPFLTLP